MANQESFNRSLSSLGVSDPQIALITRHLDIARPEIVALDPGIPDSLVWLQGQLAQVLDAPQVATLMQLVDRHLPDSVSPSSELGFDSCQSRRSLAKIIGEGLVVGGFLREYQLLGAPVSLAEAQTLAHSTLNITGPESEIFKNMVERLGADQDFLFPGVMALGDDLESAVVQTLSNHPPVTVRSLTGLGGLRADRQDNAVVDLSSFLRQKITQDRRFYPGAAVFQALATHPIDTFPVLRDLMHSYPQLYQALHHLRSCLVCSPSALYPDVATLCAVAIPSWSQLKHVAFETTDSRLELAAAFHSPAYDISFLEELISDLYYERPLSADTTILQCQMLEQQLDNLFSFNNPLHLPFTQDRSNLSHELMGQITNRQGHSCLRFGVAYQGQSLEVREYTLSADNRSSENGGAYAYELRYYPDNQLFSGPYTSRIIHPHDTFWMSINKFGFLKAALQHISTL